MGLCWPIILSENRFALFGMGLCWPIILSENRFALFGMMG
jgi:hypothetical protein